MDHEKKYEQPTVNVRIEIAALRTSMLFDFAYVDIFFLYRPDVRGALRSPPNVPSSIAHLGRSLWRAWLLKKAAPNITATTRTAESTSRSRRAICAASSRAAPPSTRPSSIPHRPWSARLGAMTDSQGPGRTARSAA